MRNELFEQRNFLTPKELSGIFDHQISVAAIDVLIREGKIPCINILAFMRKGAIILQETEEKVARS